MLTRTRTLIFIKISQPVRAPATVKGIGPNPSPLTRLVWQNCPLYSLETPALLWGSSSPDKKLICWTKHVPISGLHFFYFLLVVLARAITEVITITKLELAGIILLPSLPVVKTAIRNLLKITSPNTKLWDLVELKIAGYFSAWHLVWKHHQRHGGRQLFVVEINRSANEWF